MGQTERTVGQTKTPRDPLATKVDMALLGVKPLDFRRQLGQYSRNTI